MSVFFLIPHAEDCIDSISSATDVSKLDLLTGYCQILLAEIAFEVSAFVTPDHFLQCTVMVF